MYVTNDGLLHKRRVRVERGIYRQPSGKYSVCFMLDGTPRFRTVGYDLELARERRRTLIEAARCGVVATAPQLRFERVADWWLERLRRMVTTGERGERTLESRRYHLEHHRRLETYERPRPAPHPAREQLDDAARRLTDPEGFGKVALCVS
jgi:hypothetical protein